MPFRFRRLTVYFSTHLLVLMIAMFFTLSLVSLHEELNYTSHRQQESFAQILNVTELSTANALWQYNNVDIEASGDSLFQNPEIVMVQLIDNRNIERYYRVKSGPSTADEYLHRYDRLLYKNNVPVGEIVIVFTNYYAQQQVYANALGKAQQLALILCILGFAIWLITRPIVNDIRHLTLSAQTMAAGDLSRSIRLTTRDELGALAVSFNQIAGNLQEHLSELQINEARFRSLVANIPGIVYRCSPDENWTMEFISDTVEEISGYPASDFINNQVRSFSSIIHPDDRAYVAASLSDVSGSHRSYSIEYRIIARDASIHWMHENGQEIYDENQTLLWLDGIIFDISGRKETDTRLQQYTQRLEAGNHLASLILSAAPLSTISLEIINKLTSVIPCSEAALFSFPLNKPQVCLLAASGPIPLHWQDNLSQPAAKYPWVEKLQAGLPLAINDQEGVAQPLEKDDTPIHMEFPLLMGSQLIGTLHLAALPGKVFSSDDQAMAASVSSLLALALQRHELEEQRIEAETALRNSERKYRTLFEGANDAFLIIENDRFVECNEKLLHLFGRTREELLHASPLDFSPPTQIDGRSSAEAATEYLKLALNGEAQCFLWNHLHADGSLFTVEISLNRIFLPPKTLIIAALRDVTDRLLAQDRLQRANEDLERRVSERTAQLESANRELEAFSYSVSHDLRAPLRSIDGFSLALLEDYAQQLDAQAKSYLERVRNASQRMGALIDDMLKLSRITRCELHPVTIDLTLLAEEVGQELREQHPDRSVDLMLEPGLTVLGDERLLRIVLENLMNNAWKFTAAQNPAQISLRQTGQDAQGRNTYCLQDNGAGFDMTYSAKLFGAFQRLHRESEFPGTGIGLATVQRIIHLHGGRIWATGTPGKGACFYFTLPSANTPSKEVLL
ncbi:PAS domain S-box protein [Azotosporobacter soli]|uniref:PAS domain S-box protein n=1 Tax=Azotosporobacter soli TaxID=3055040 RepID=UPI0031FE862C